jgi:hypothetical protein
MEAATSNYGNQHEAVGKIITYCDEHGRKHPALITAVWGTGPEALGVNPINVIYVSGDDTKHDPYGRQVERASSVQAAGPTAAHGRYYTAP